MVKLVLLAIIEEKYMKKKNIYIYCTTAGVVLIKGGTVILSQGVKCMGQ